MTGASLGLRSLSYGSLQQQLQNGSLLPTQSPPVTVRKPAKMSLSGSREKERILVRVCKFAGRRKVGMLLLLIASVAVLSSNSVLWKACPVCYVPVEHAALLMPPSPSPSPLLKSLSYISEVNLIANESNGGSVFGGHPSFQERIETFNIKESMTVHCGFSKGMKPGQGTGFDIDETDLLEMEECYDVVASAIFGNYDIMQQPKNVSDYAKRHACFYMFVDEETETYIKNSSGSVNTKRVGLWRVVVVRNLPYVDARRNGKVPKILLHRLFPNARFSLCIDGKLELAVDPYQVLERITIQTHRYNQKLDIM